LPSFGISSAALIFTSKNLPRAQDD